MADGLRALNPLSYWEFSELTGTSAVNAMGGTRATLLNGASFATGGARGRGAMLDGVNDLVSVAHSGAYALNAGAISLWFNPVELGRTQGLISKNSQGLDAGGGFSLVLRADGTLRFDIESATAVYSIVTTAAADIGAWSNVVISWGATGLQLWLNGVQVGTSPYTGGLGTSSGGAGADDPLVFGANTQNAGDGSLIGASDFFRGGIDEAVVLSRQPTASEIAAIYLNGSVSGNANPVATNDTLAVAENGPVAVSGNVLANDTDADGPPLTVFAVSGATASVGAAVAGTYGALTLNADGSYAYALNATATNVQGLRDGQSVTDSFAYTATDGRGGLSTASLVVTISGQNDAPVVTAETRTITEDPGAVALTGNVLTNDRDIDGGTLAIAGVNGLGTNVGAPVASAYGAITIGANGAYTYTLANTSAAVQGLKAGQVVEDVFAYTVSDGQGGATSTSITVRITGRNDAPVATADAGAVDAAAPAPVVGNVLGNDSDVDGDLFTVDRVRNVAASVGQPVVGVYGTLTLGADGSYAYVLNAADADTIALRPGQIASDTFSYRVNDGQGGTATANLVIAVTGANDAPRPVNDLRTVQEDAGALTLNGNVLTNDRDPDGGALSVGAVAGAAGNVGAPVEGAYGSLTVDANGAYLYTLANASPTVQALRAGQSVTDTFTYAVADGQGGTASANVTVTVTGRNDAPTVLSATTATVQENATLTATGSILPNIRDIDAGDTLTVNQVRGQTANVGIAVAGTFGALTLQANGTFIYTLNNGAANVQALNAGQQVTDSFTYRANDGSGAQLTNTLVVTVQGKAEVAPTITSNGADATAGVNVAENTTAVTTVTATDPDLGDLIVFSIVPGADGNLFQIDAQTGALSFIQTQDFEHPNPNGQDIDQFHDVRVRATDLRGLFDEQLITVNVTDVNDVAPVLAAPIPDQSAMEDAPFSFIVPVGTFTDVDTGTVLVYSATRPDGSPLPAWLSLDPATGTFTGTPGNEDDGVLSVRATASDGVYTASDVFNIAVAPVAAPASIVFGGATLAAASGEIAVNTTQAFGHGSPSIAALSDGGFVVVWAAEFDGSARGVLGQRFDASGAPAGNEFQVNVTTVGDQNLPRLTAMPGGGFAVAWESALNGVYESYLRIYGSNGMPVTGEVLATPTIAARDQNPAIATLANDELVIAWQSGSQSGGGSLYVQRFSAGGAQIGGPAEVVASTFQPAVPALAPLNGGGFVLVWQSHNQDGSDLGIVGRRFDAAGVALGGEIIINQTSTSDQQLGSAAALPGGGFVVSWTNTTETLGPPSRPGRPPTVIRNEDVFARIFDADGQPVGAEFRANASIAGNQYGAAPVVLENGAILISWFQQGGGVDGVYGRIFDAAGVPLGDATQIDNPALGAAGTSNVGPVGALLSNGKLAYVINRYESVSVRLFDGSSPFAGAEDGGGIRLPIVVSAAEAGETVTQVTLSGFPKGSVLSAGSPNIDGTEWTFAVAPPANLTLTAPANYNGVFMLTVTATTQDGADTETTTTTRTVTVTSVNDAPIARADVVHGDADVIVTNENFVYGLVGDGQLFLGDGLGGFTRQSTPSIDFGVRGIAAGDIDGDSDTDIVSALGLFGSNGQVISNNGGASFTITQTLPPSSLEVTDIALGDLDGDGDLDAFATAGSSFGGGTNLFDRVWLNNGAGQFVATGQLLGSGTGGSFDVELADFDGDGDLDAVTGGVHDDTTDLFVNNGLGVFTRTVIASGGSFDSTIASTDFDRDGDIDLLIAAGVAGSGVPTGVRALANNGQGQFTAAPVFAGGASSVALSASRGVAAGDLDNDGDEDFIVNADGGAHVFRNDNGVFVNTGQALAIITSEKVVLSDFDFDGDLDALLHDFEGGARLFSNNGEGVFADTGTRFAAFRTWESVATDLDNDGISEDRVIVIRPLDNDADAEGGLLTITSVGTTALGAQVSINADGRTLTYNPTAAAGAQALGADQFANDTFTYTVSDGQGGTATAMVSIRVRGVNDAPTVANAIADQGPSEDAAFSFTVPADAFSDVDNASLTFSATLANGDMLPAWLSFNAATRTFSGTPANADKGANNVRVIASDASANASDVFALTVGGTAATANISFGASAALTPIDAADVLVNTTTTDRQQHSGVAALSNGGSVVVWTSLNQDGSLDGIYAQRFSETGAPVGSEFRVNTTTFPSQFYPSVAALADGGFYVTWTADQQDGSVRGVYGQRYNASGAAAGTETRINTFTAGEQAYSSAAGTADGGYVVTWSSFGQDGANYGVYVQRYSAAGTALGAETRVNTTTANHQQWSSVAGLADGGYVVSWQAFDGSTWDIYVQRYDAAGAAIGGETRVNTTLTGTQDDGRLISLADGGFVVTWSSQGQDGSGYGVYSQRYDASGAPVAGESRVNTTVVNNQFWSHGAALADGGYVVTWSSDDGSGFGIYAQRFDASGARVGGETRLNATTAGNQYNEPIYSDPGVAVTNQGVVIQTFFGDGEVYIRRFDATTAFSGSEDRSAIPLPITVAATEPGEAVTQVVLSGLPAGSVLSTGTSNGDGTAWTFADAPPTNLTLTPPANYSGAFTLTVTATTQDGTDVEVTSATQSVFVASVVDTLVGGPDPDVLASGPGPDVLTGGSGADSFVFAASYSGPDTISDFVPGQDHLEISASGFGGGLVAGGAAALTANANPSTSGANGQFLYDTDDGRLFWDQDGAGAWAPALLATLTGAPAFSQTDIIFGL